MQRLTALGVSPGVARGRAVVRRPAVRGARRAVAPDRVEGELARLDEAALTARAELDALTHRVAASLGDDTAALFDAQRLMLSDPLLLGRARTTIATGRVNAEWALEQAAETLFSVFETSPDRHLRERNGDLADVVDRLLVHLAGERPPAVGGPGRADERAILVVTDLAPSVAVELDWSSIAGFVTERGSWTHHAAILARSLGVPGVMGLADATRCIEPGATLVLDGRSGEVVVDPDDAVFSDFVRRPVRRPRARVADRVREPAVTRDGVEVSIGANVERLDDVPSAVAAGADTIGLFRSEFLLGTMTPEDWTEERQVEAYVTLLSRAPGTEITIRTFDLGERVGTARAQSSATRGVRHGLANREVLGRQLRALVRAAPAGRLRIMIPFVTGLEEMQVVTSIVRDAERAAGRGDGPGVPVGTMVELPAAVMIADRLGGRTDFLSLGTNDLVQYALGVDRRDDPLGIYEPLHPGVLKLIRSAIRAARRADRRLSVCGEMATDPAGLALLLGLGVVEFSMTPSAIAPAKDLVRSMSVGETRQIAGRALTACTASDVRREVERWLRGRAVAR